MFFACVSGVCYWLSLMVVVICLGRQGKYSEKFVKGILLPMLSMICTARYESVLVRACCLLIAVFCFSLHVRIRQCSYVRMFDLLLFHFRCCRMFFAPPCRKCFQAYPTGVIMEYWNTNSTHNQFRTVHGSYDAAGETYCFCCDVTMAMCSGLVHPATCVLARVFT